MSSIDEESISAEEEASSADWFDMDADELAANLRVQLQLKSNVVDEGDTVATPPHNHHVNDKKVVPYEDDENDEGECLCLISERDYICVVPCAFWEIISTQSVKACDHVKLYILFGMFHMKCICRGL